MKTIRYHLKHCHQVGGASGTESKQTITLRHREPITSLEVQGGKLRDDCAYAQWAGRGKILF